ncbi:MAG: glycosyltransferase family 2 protein [Arenimonas sp.]
MQDNDVTIAIPVYNEERFIAYAVQSALPQCQVLLVSDNASTDGSFGIAETLCEDHRHARCHRQTENIGAANNFKFLLDQATTPYFMWLGGHDAIPDGYVAKLKQALDENKNAVLAFGAAQHITADGKPAFVYDYFYSDSLIDDSASERVLGLVRFLSDCSLIHGIFRTDTLRKAWADEKYLGMDHVLLTKAALDGKLVYVPETHLLRRDVHSNDTPEAQLVRITGTTGDESGKDYTGMQKQQYELASIAIGGKSLSSLFFLMKTRYYLVLRFGPFARRASTRLLERLLCRLLSIPGRLIKSS